MFVVFLNIFRHLFSLLAAELLIVLPTMRKRNNFPLRLSASLAVCVVFCVFYGLYYSLISEYIANMFVWFLSMLLAVILISTAVICVCFKIRVTSFFWIITVSYAVEHIVWIIIYQLLFMKLINSEVDMLVQLAVYIVLCSAAYACLHWIMKPNTRYLDEQFLHNTPKSGLLFVILFLIFIVASMLNQLSANIISEVGLDYLCAFSDLINCSFILILQFIMLIVSRISFEKQLIERLMREEALQYEVFKMSVDYINVKCHDLKHELAAVYATGKVDDEALAEIEENIKRHESFVNTGNKTLDVLLTEKKLVCSAAGIAIVCMADASGLDFMKASDLYVLFSNLLDNAIEYLRGVSDVKKRSVKLTIKQNGNMVFIHCENYFEGKAEFVGKLPRTTKKDTISHGFGIISMKRTAKKYGGDLKVTAGDGRFQVDIFVCVN